MYSIIKSGMASAMHELSVISNNVSNANSNGFKKSLVSFADFAGGLFPASVQSSANGLGSMVEETRVSRCSRCHIINRKQDRYGSYWEWLFCSSKFK